MTKPRCEMNNGDWSLQRKRNATRTQKRRDKEEAEELEGMSKRIKGVEAFGNLLQCHTVDVSDITPDQTLLCMEGDISPPVMQDPPPALAPTMEEARSAALKALARCGDERSWVVEECPPSDTEEVDTTTPTMEVARSCVLKLDFDWLSCLNQ